MNPKTSSVCCERKHCYAEKLSGLLGQHQHLSSEPALGQRQRYWCHITKAGSPVSKRCQTLTIHYGLDLRRLQVNMAGDASCPHSKFRCQLDLASANRGSSRNSHMPMRLCRQENPPTMKKCDLRLLTVRVHSPQ